MQPATTTRTQPLWQDPRVFPVLLIALLAETGYAIVNISTMPLYLTRDRGFGEGSVSLIVACFLISETIFKGPMGHLADKLGKRRLLTLGPALTVLTTLGTLFLPQWNNLGEGLALAMLRILDGLGAAMIWPAAFALMAESTDDKRQQEGMSLLNTCYFVGIAIAFLLGGIVNDAFGRVGGLFGKHSPSLFLAAGMFAFVSLVSFQRCPSGKNQRARYAESKQAAQDEGIHDARGFLSAFKRIPQFVVLGLLTFIGVGVPMIIMKPFFLDQYKLSETQFAFLVLPGAVAMALSSVPMSKFGERVGRERAVHFGLFLCAAGLTALAMGAFVPWCRTLPWLALGGIPVGIGFLLVIPAWYSSVSDIDPENRASNIGAVMTAQGIGAILGAPLGGKLYELFGRGQDATPLGRYSPFLACALIVIAAWLISLRILHPPRKVVPSTPEGE